MQYPVYGRSGERCLTVSALCGGLDATLPDTALGADRLRDVCNLWWKDGALRTRPAVRNSLTQWPNFGTVRQQVFLPEAVTLDGVRGFLCLLLHQVDSGYSLGAVLLDEDGEAHIIRETVTPDWAVCPEQILPIGAGSDGAELYLDAKPYRLAADGTLTAVSPYVPTVLIAGRGVADYTTAKNMSIAAGTTYEPFNRLTEAFKMDFFLTDDVFYYTLPAFTRHRPAELTVTLKGLMTFNIPLVSTTGEGPIHTDPILGYSLHWSPATGVFWFMGEADVDTPNTEKWSEMTVTYRPADDRPSDLEWIRSMTIATWFGGTAAGLGGGTRCFLAGSQTEPNRLCYTAADDFTYLPENNDARVGQAGQAITALKKQAEMLVIFKEHEIWYSSYLVGTTDSEALTLALESGTVVDVEAALARFPLALLAWNVGCDRPDTIALCDNRLVWANSDGRVYLLASGNIYSERNVREIGQSIYPLLTARRESICTAVDYEGHYLLFAGNEVFLFNYRDAGLGGIGAATAEDTLRKRMAWYRWEFPASVKPTVAVVGHYPLLFDGTMVWVLNGERDQHGAIRTMLQLPQNTLGRIDRKKSVRLAVMDGGQPYATVAVTAIDSRGLNLRNQQILTADADGVIRLHPALRRVSRFALRIEANGAIAWREMLFYLQV